MESKDALMCLCVIHKTEILLHNRLQSRTDN